MCIRPPGPPQRPLGHAFYRNWPSLIRLCIAQPHGTTAQGCGIRETILIRRVQAVCSRPFLRAPTQLRTANRRTYGLRPPTRRRTAVFSPDVSNEELFNRAWGRSRWQYDLRRAIIPACTTPPHWPDGAVTRRTRPVRHAGSPPSSFSEPHCWSCSSRHTAPTSTATVDPPFPHKGKRAPFAKAYRIPRLVHNPSAEVSAT